MFNFNPLNYERLSKTHRLAKGSQVGAGHLPRFLQILQKAAVGLRSESYARIDKDVNEVKAMLISLLQKIRKEIKP